MILYSNRSIKEITKDLGVESVYDCSRLFKQKTGVPPLQFREVKQKLIHISRSQMD